MTALGRVQITRGTPVCQPGRCIICGNCGGPEQEFVDFGLEIEFYGVVYFCTHCVQEISEAVGFFPVDRFLELEQRLQEQIDKYTKLEAENGELRNALDSLNRVSFVFNSTSDSQLSMDEVEPEPTKPVEPAIKPKPARKARSTKQNDESGSTSVSDNESIGSVFKL